MLADLGPARHARYRVPLASEPFDEVREDVRAIETQLLRHGPIAGAREALGECARIVVEHRAEQSPARADPLDLARRVLSRARALSANRVGSEPVPERQRHLLERQL